MKIDLIFYYKKNVKQGFLYFRWTKDFERNELNVFDYCSKSKLKFNKNYELTFQVEILDILLGSSFDSSAESSCSVSNNLW